MKLHSKPTYYLSILSLGIILYILGISAILSLHSQLFSDYFKQQQNFVLDLKENIAESDQYIIQQFLKSNPQINRESIRFIPKAEGLELMKQELNDPELFLNIENPLQDIFQFRMVRGDINNHSIDNLRKELTSLSGVIGLHYQEDPYQSLDQLTQKFSRILIIGAFLLLLFSLVLIYNTLRLMLASQEKRIFTMQMVGARNSFILNPYLKTGAKIGLWAGVIAIISILITFYIIHRNFSFPLDILNFSATCLIFILLFVFGILFSLICSYIIVNKYLKTLDTSGIDS